MLFQLKAIPKMYFGSSKYDFILATENLGRGISVN